MAKASRDVERVKEAIKASEVLPGEKRVLLLQVLSSLEGEIQARDVTLGVIKSEYFKNFLCNATESKDTGISASNGDGHLYRQDPGFALLRDNLYSMSNLSLRRPGATKFKFGQSDTYDINFLRLQNSLNKHKMALKKSLICLRESERLKNGYFNQIEDLKKETMESHPDSKGEKDAAKDEKEEEEKHQEIEDENQTSKQSVESLKSQLEEEQKQKMQMIAVLVNDRKQIAMKYLEEKYRTDQLSRLLKEEKKKSQKLALELEEESKRSLSMEAETELYIRQINELQEETKRSILEEKRRTHDMEELCRRTKQEAEHLRKQLAEAHRVAMSQASVGVIVPPPLSSNSCETSSAYGQKSDMGSLGKGSKSKKQNEEDVDNSEPFYGMRQAPRNPNTRSVGVKSDSPSSGVSTASSMLSSGNASINAMSGTQTVLKKPLKGIVPPPLPPNKPNLTRNYPATNHDNSSTSVENRKIRYINE